MRTKGMGPQGLGVKGNNGYHIGSPAKQKKSYSDLAKRMPNFNQAKDTLIVGTSNNQKGAMFVNKQKRNRGVREGKMEMNANDSSFTLEDGKYEYITQHKKKKE